MTLRDLTAWPLRAWRRHGHGVHSPFAFSLITNTIAERSPFYCYAELRKLSRRDFAKTSLIVRLTARFQPSEAVIIGDRDGVLAKAVELADSRVTRLADIADATTRPAASPKVFLANPLVVVDDAAGEVKRVVGAVYLFFNLDRCENRRQWERLLNGMDYGMDFSDGKTGIFCALKPLRRQSFNVKI